VGTFGSVDNVSPGGRLTALGRRSAAASSFLTVSRPWSTIAFISSWRAFFSAWTYFADRRVIVTVSSLASAPFDESLATKLNIFFWLGGLKEIPFILASEATGDELPIMRGLAIVRTSPFNPGLAFDASAPS